jgi:hypothetical protein
VQDHQAQGQGHGYLREPQAQAEAGLTIAEPPEANKVSKETKQEKEIQEWLV